MAIGQERGCAILLLAVEVLGAAPIHLREENKDLQAQWSHGCSKADASALPHVVVLGIHGLHDKGLVDRSSVDFNRIFPLKDVGVRIIGPVKDGIGGHRDVVLLKNAACKNA